MLDTQSVSSSYNGSGTKKARIIWGFIAFLTLTSANVLTFYPHYVGGMTFPWDFLGGYHAHAFTWFADGSFFNPPKWFPWADMGFPAYWSLQSGAFYIPLALLDLANQPYTIQAATILQILHVLAGAVGMYVLLRTLDIAPPFALVGALAFHFSSTFYSNAQHVDIIRAAAFLPWLMWSLHPAVIFRSWVRPVIAALILFQFLIAAYPGLIVSAAYTLALFVGAYSLPYLRHGKILRLAVVFSLVGASAVAMASLKWLPPFVEGDRTPTAVGGGMFLSPHLLLTLFLPYDKPFLPSDVTMRSIWLPAGLLVGIAFLTRLSLTSKVALSLIVAALLFSGIGPVLYAAPLPLPGYGLSRFLLSDWRPTLHIGLIVLACAGWQSSIAHSRPAFILRRSVLVAVSMLFLAWVAVGQGYTLGDLYRSALTVSVALLLVLAHAILLRLFSAERIRLSHLVLFGLVALVAIESYNFHHREQRSWRVGWNKDVEMQVFGHQLSRMNVTDREPLSIERRPERLVVGADHNEVVQQQLSGVYNRCFYLADFCSLGYNNLRLSLPHVKYRQAVTDPVQGPKLLAFVRQPQKLFVMPKSMKFDLSAISSQPTEAAIESLVPGVDGSVVGYGGEWARYRLSTPDDVRVVENEIWTSGWSVRLCQNGHCLSPKTPKHTPQYLRTWLVPAGTWDIELFFQVRSERYIWLFFYSGILLMLGAGVFAHRFGNGAVRGR